MTMSKSLEEIRKELKEIQVEGQLSVFVNGWREKIGYVLTLENLVWIDYGVYETKDS